MRSHHGRGHGSRWDEGWRVQGFAELGVGGPCHAWVVVALFVCSLGVDCGVQSECLVSEGVSEPNRLITTT